jgi:hypothetical protein
MTTPFEKARQHLAATITLPGWWWVRSFAGGALSIVHIEPPDPDGHHEVTMFGGGREPLDALLEHWEFRGRIEEPIDVTYQIAIRHSRRAWQQRRDVG